MTATTLLIRKSNVISGIQWKLKTQGSLFKVIKLLRWQQQSIKPNVENIYVWDSVWLHKSQACDARFASFLPGPKIPYWLNDKVDQLDEEVDVPDL